MNLDEKLKLFRSLWKEKVESTPFNPFTYRQERQTMGKKNALTPETPDDVIDEPDTPTAATSCATEANAAPETAEVTVPASFNDPDKGYNVAIFAFDLNVWQMHDIEAKLHAFGGHGVEGVGNFTSTPPAAPESVEAEPAAATDEQPA